jgi:CHAT domain-containing protein/tetratricopeptide (TPR) repeat protein
LARSSLAHPMMTLRLILLLVLYILLSVTAQQAQNEDILAREGDESAITAEARQSALTALLAAARQSRGAGEGLKAAGFLNRAGRLQLQLSLPKEALATYQEALELLKQTPAPTMTADSLNGLGAVYSHLSKCEEAQNFLQQAITLSEQNHYVAGKAEALLKLSDCQNYSDHGLALRTAQEALALWQSINHKRGLAKTFVAIGHYQLTQNNLLEATQSHEAALGLWRELEVANEQAAALIYLGFIEYRKGAWQNVCAYLAQAQDLLDERAEPYKMGQINSGLGEAFVESGLPEIGLDKYLQALENFRQTQDPRAVIGTILGIGKTYYILGNYTEAQANLQRALADSRSIKETTFMAFCNDLLGRTFAAMNDQPAALGYYEVALNLYTQTGNLMEAARVRALMGQVYQQQGRVEQARTAYQKALQTFRDRLDQVNQSATFYALGSLELQQGNLDIAEDYLRQSIEVTENMRRVSTSRDLTAAFSASVYERYEKYVECLMRQHHGQRAQGLMVRAFETSEVSRARSLAELLRATQTNLITGLDGKLAEQEKALRQALKVKEDTKVGLLGRAYGKEELAALDAELLQLQAEYKQVSETIEARYPAYKQLTRPTVWDLSQIQQQVIADDQTLLLEYSLGADRSYVWAVTRDDIKSYQLPARKLVNEAAQKVYKLLTTSPEANLGPNLAKELTLAIQHLSQMVLAPVGAELGAGKQRIIIVADGALHYIPFQILLTSTATDEPLIASYEIINTPSASILGELRKQAERQQPIKLLAAFGDPVFPSNYAQHSKTTGNEQPLALQTMENAGWQPALRDIELSGDSFDPLALKPLFYAKGELAALLESASGGQTFVASGFAATREQLLSTDLSQYAILHFATHGLLDPKRPEYSGLVLSTMTSKGQAQNGFVTLQDIYGLRAPVDLVVLSACQTGLGKDVNGEGLLGLTRGFMYAGASSVVASLWKVDDEATAALMRQFYINMLQKGMTPASALQAAQNSIRQRSGWHMPYYWAGFTLQGEYRRVIHPLAVGGAGKTYRNLIIGGVLILLAGGAIWYGRRRRQRSPMS